MDRPIYLDYNATTPIAPEVARRDAARSLRSTSATRRAATLTDMPPTRPSRGALAGRAAARLRAGRDRLHRRRQRGEQPGDQGRRVRAGAEHGDHLITSAVEHPAVLATCSTSSQRFGYRLTVVPVDGHGLVDPDDVARALEPGTVLITIMHANNEVGTIQPIAEIGRRRGGTASPSTPTPRSRSGRSRPSVDDLGVDLLTVVGHKMYAPKGIGALYVRPGTILDSLIHGAGHEGGRRAGTENVPYIVALGAACALAGERLARRRRRRGSGAARPTP